MNQRFSSARRTLVACFLAATIASVPVGSAAVAAGPGQGPSTPPFLVDGFWSLATCGFAYAVAFQLRVPLENAAMICAYVFSVD